MLAGPALLVVLSCANADANANADIAALLAQVDAAHRSWDVDGLAREGALLDELERAAPGRADTLWRKARWHTCAIETEGDVKKALVHARAAVALSDKAIAADPDSVAAHFYAATAIAMYGDLIGVTRGIVERVDTQFRAKLDWVLAHDADFAGGAARALEARFLDVMPWPLRDRSRAIATLRSVVSQHTDNVRARFFLGDALAADGDRDEAVAVLRAVVAADVASSADPPQARLAKRWAVDRLTQLAAWSAADAAKGPAAAPMPPGVARVPATW